MGGSPLPILDQSAGLWGKPALPARPVAGPSYPQRKDLFYQNLWKMAPIEPQTLTLVRDLLTYLDPAGLATSTAPGPPY